MQGLSQLGLIIFPYRCLVCERTLKLDSRLCRRCRPPEPWKMEPGVRCQSCFSPLARPARLCPPCAVMPLNIKRARYLWEYEGNVRHIITTMKYRPSFKLASFISEIMAENLNDLFKDEQQDSHWDLLIPLPSSSQSKSRRMFNQCSLLTLAIMRRTGLSAGQSIQQFFKRPALMHLGYSSQQATIKGADKRVSNVKGAFSASSGLVNGKAVLLVEDVVTSGATSLAAACALVKAGAASVDLIMLARHRGWQQHRRQMFEKFCV